MKNYILLVSFLFLYSGIFSQTITAPIDHNNINIGNFKLEYEFGMPYNPKLPTVIVVSDAQQFYVRKGRISKIQEELFGKDFNVLGLIPRSTSQELIQKMKLITNERIDWRLAYSIFKSYQFINDIELIIKEVLKEQQNIYLYGQSGGAFLITEYLSQFPSSKVKKVFIGASVNSVVEHKLGILHDNFYRDYLTNNNLEKRKLDSVLSVGFFDRSLIASLFQRQNFFVELADLSKNRSVLVDRLYARDTAYVNKLKKEYQIDALNNLFETDRGISIRVRIAEFIYPLLGDWGGDRTTFYPDLENSYNVAYPLLVLKSNDLDFQFLESFNERTFRKYNGEVFILSGRYDHVADYRSSIYLNGLLENSSLFIVDDEHTFKSLKSNDDYRNLIQDFFSSNNKEWMLNYNKYQWKEQ